MHLCVCVCVYLSFPFVVVIVCAYLFALLQEKNIKKNNVFGEPLSSVYTYVYIEQRISTTIPRVPLLRVQVHFIFSGEEENIFRPPVVAVGRSLAQI